MATDTRADIEKAIADNKVILFMKGTPSFPQCGFSAQVVDILRRINVPFAGVNVLADPNIRQGIKDFSNWPTIPQLYVAGEFIGGSDITVQLYETGELKQKIDAAMAAPL